MNIIILLLFFILISGNILANIPIDGTPAGYILTNKIYGIGDNITKISNLTITNVATNCGGQFIKVTGDINNGYAGGTFYFTNKLKNWGNATDIFLLSIADTNTNGLPALPWEIWFENLSGERITNIKIGPGKTNTFLFAIKVSSFAHSLSYAEFKIVAKSSNSELGHNTTIYTGDNKYNYGGPDNGGIGTCSEGEKYICIYSNSTTEVDNNEFLRVTIIKISNYYINDRSTTGDIWCSVIGDDSNSGSSPSHPKFTLTNLLHTYNLEPGDTIYIDTGTYTQSFTIKNEDRGDSSGYVTIRGAGISNTIFNFTNVNFGIKLTNENYIKLSSMFLKNANNQNLYLDYTTNTIITNIKSGPSKGDGAFLYDSDNNKLLDLIIVNNINYGINFYHSCDKNRVYNVYVSNCNVGLRIRNSSSNSIVNSKFLHNTSSGVYITNSGFTFVTNNSVENNSGDGIAAPGCDNVIIYSNFLYNNGVDGITLYQLDGNWADNNFICRNISIKNGSDGMHINGNKNRIISNIFATNTQNGIDLYGATNYVKNNEIFSNHSTGIWLGGAAGVIISNNNIYLNGANGIGTAGKSGTTFISNKIYNNHSSGISLWWSGSSCNDHNVIKNIIYNNGEEGIYIDGSNNLIISNLIYSNSNNGIYMKGGIFTNMFNLIYNNNKNGIIGENLTTSLIRNCTLFKNGYNGLKLLNPNNVYNRNCISVSNNIAGYTNFDNLTYSLGYGNSSIDFSATTGIECITNNPYFITTNPVSTNFLHLSGDIPSPAINAGDPIDSVPANGGSRIDMGCFECPISTTTLNVQKSVNKITRNGISSTAIPGATIEYKIHFTNTGNVAENSIVYDAISYRNFVYVSNSYTNSEEGWIVEFSTNIYPSQIYNSSDYTNIDLFPDFIKWIRWKKGVVGAHKSGNFYFKVIIK